MRKKINFEDGLKTLEDIVSKLEKGELKLEESLNEFEKGITLYNDLNKILGEAEGKIKIILKDDENNYVEKDFNKEV